MKKQLVLLVITFFLGGFALGAQEQGGNQKFHTAQVISAGEITYPSGATSSGTLVFEAWISAEGAFSGVKVRRALEPFTEPAIQAIKGWKFRPATLGGKPAASSVTVAVTVNPRVELPPSVPLPPLQREDKMDRPQTAFEAADVSHAAFPPYPVGAVNPGTVVLESLLNEKGQVERTRVIRDFPPYTAKALEIVGSWKFTPARLNGKPVSSQIVLAFVFPTLTAYPIRNDH